MKRGKLQAFGRGLMVVLSVAAMIGFLQVSGPMAQETNGDLQANLDNVQVEDFIKFIGRYTGRNIIYRTDQIPKVKFNIFSQNPIGESELMAIFHELLASIGLQAVAKEDVLYIMPNNLAKNINTAVERSTAIEKGIDEELVTTVYQLSDGVPDKAAQTLLKVMSSPVGLVQPIPQAQAVLIRDTRERIDKMISLLDSIQDVRPQWTMEMVKLEEADATNVAKKVAQIYTTLLKEGRIVEAPLITDVPWSNSFLVVGTKELIDDIRSLVPMLDRVDEAASGIKIYRLQNSKATSVAEVLQSLVQVVVDAKQQQVKTVSNAFKVSADEDTNSVIVFGTKEIFAQVEDVIAKLDKPQDQVFIESVIMETSLDNSRRFGVEWLLGGADGDAGIGNIGFITDPSSSNLLSYASPLLGENPTVPNIASLGSGFSLGILGNMITYNGQSFPTMGAMVNFIKDVSEISILSTPQVMTLNNSEAEVFVGENRPFLTTEKYDSNNNPVQSYDYRDVGYKLKVQPQINSNSGLIRLDIEQEVNSVTDTSLQPVTLTRYTKTTVQLLDGSTIVISGLVRDDLNRTRSGMPGLANIPLLGWLFKTDSVSGQKATLMVFIRAKIIRTLESTEALTSIKRQVVDENKKKTEKYFEQLFDFGNINEEEKMMFNSQEVLDPFTDPALAPLIPSGDEMILTPTGEIQGEPGTRSTFESLSGTSVQSASETSAKETVKPATTTVQPKKKPIASGEIKTND